MMCDQKDRKLNSFDDLLLGVVGNKLTSPSRFGSRNYNFKPSNLLRFRLVDDTELDHWLRRRVRMCYWKQWRRTRTRVRELLKLGTGKRHAIFTALSRKSYWHLSKTLATQTGMTNQWLQRQGLLSIRDLWMTAHGYA